MVNFRRSLVITFFASSGATVVQFIVSLVLARLLLPSEIGVFSMTVVFVNIAHVFRDFGVGAYLLRETELTTEKLRSAMGVLYTSSWIIAVALFFSSSSIALWFNEPEIAPVMRVLSVGFFFIPFGSITHTLLNREFAAGKQAQVTALATICYAATALGLAWLGFGTMSLAWANLVNIIVSGVAYIPFRPKGTPWLPSFRNWSKILHFGLGSLITNCSGAINNSLPDILLGKLSGARDVGLFSRANSTVTIFGYIAGTTVNYGAMTYVSQTHSRGESLTPLLTKAIGMLTGIGWPILGVTAVLSYEIVLALYGPKWVDSAAAVPVLAISGMLGMMFNYTPTALTALNRPYLSAVPILLSIAVRIAIALMIFDGTLISFSWALLAASVATVPIMLFQQHHYLGYHTKSMAVALYPSALVTLACTVMAVLCRLVMPASFPALANVMLASLPITAVWYLALRFTRHSLLAEVHHFADGLKARLVRA